MLDESLSGVDQPSTAELFEVFERLAASGITLLLATHDLALARRKFPRCMAINGRLLGDGPPDDGVVRGHTRPHLRIGGAA